jgi:hypothetical protein
LAVVYASVDEGRRDEEILDGNFLLEFFKRTANPDTNTIITANSSSNQEYSDIVVDTIVCLLLKEYILIKLYHIR